MILRLSLRIRIFLLFVGLAGGAILALIVGLWLGYSRLGGPENRDAFIQGGVFASFVILGVVSWVWYLFDCNVAKPIDRLAGALRARAHADVTGPLDTAIAHYLGDLAPAASAASASLAETRNALAEAVARETTHLLSENARLETLLSDVGVGVLMCSGEHLLVFYNAQAADLIDAGSVSPGLDRNLFDYLRPGPIRLAYDRLLATGDIQAATDITCTTGNGSRVLSARMRLIATSSASLAGYVLTLRDVTADLAAQTGREALLNDVFARLRRPAANLSTLIDAIPEGSVPVGGLEAALRQEVALMTSSLNELLRRHEEGRAGSVMHTLTRASDLLEGLRARLEDGGLTVHTRSDELILRCNGFEILAVLSGLAEAIWRSAQPNRFEVSLTEEDTGALIRMSWTGPHLPLAQLDAWLDEPLEEGISDLSRRAVLSSHATDIWPEHVEPDTASLCLPIPLARRVVSRPAPIARPPVYDFDLLSKARNAKVQDSRLLSLTYVVFDTETTGLLPSQGDELVQVAAVRIVNGRRVEGEIFDTLVNPNRRIPAESTAVHGITDAMVQNAPSVADVLSQFHKFAEGAVLVAHNAPFDMEFLRRQEKTLGLRFDHPVLDTVLLSAVIYGQHEVHSLDALTHRLGITIPEEARHTAIGDAVATSDAFLKLMTMLQGRGLITFGDILSEVRRHGRLLKDLNK